MHAVKLCCSGPVDTARSESSSVLELFSSTYLLSGSHLHACGETVLQWAKGYSWQYGISSSLDLSSSMYLLKSTPPCMLLNCAAVIQLIQLALWCMVIVSMSLHIDQCRPCACFKASAVHGKGSCIPCKGSC